MRVVCYVTMSERPVFRTSAPLRGPAFRFRPPTDPLMPPPLALTGDIMRISRLKSRRRGFPVCGADGSLGGGTAWPAGGASAIRKGAGGERRGAGRSSARPISRSWCSILPACSCAYGRRGPVSSNGTGVKGTARTRQEDGSRGGAEDDGKRDWKAGDRGGHHRTPGTWAGAAGDNARP